jgi:hypothetical protein
MRLTPLALIAVSASTPIIEAAFSGRQPVFLRSTMQGHLRQRNSAATRAPLHLSSIENPDKVDVDAPAEQPGSEEPFVNDGPFSWMTNYLGVYEDGKSLAYGVPVAADTTRTSTPDTIAEEKQLFTENLMNIGTDERERRRKGAQVAWVVTAIYVLWASLIADHGDLAGHFARFMAFLPFSLAIGYQKSADSGL